MTTSVMDDNNDSTSPIVSTNQFEHMIGSVKNKLSVHLGTQKSFFKHSLIFLELKVHQILKL